MGKIIDITGLKFNRLLVVRLIGINKENRSLWNCKCDCGKFCVVSGTNLRRNNTKSCGCLVKEKNIERGTHNLTNTKFYEIHHKIKQRCSNINDPSYEYYGGRGITYDSRWNNFLEFKKDMRKRYNKYIKILGEKNITIERIDVNKNYCKENCTFTHKSNQAKNRRVNRKFKAISPYGKIYSSNNMKGFGKEHGLSPSDIRYCLQFKKIKKYRGWRFNYA